MMKTSFISSFAFANLLITAPLVVHGQAQAQEAIADTSPHMTQTVTADDGAKLEVLDWGGKGSPLILLIGLGGTAHSFDKFALDFTANHHVYAITRRGYGASSAPDPDKSDYSAERLGKDVIAVIDALKIDKPVLAGHSIAGEELTAVANQHPEMVSGLIYLDGGNAYAYYAPGNLIPFGANLTMDLKELEVETISARNRAEVQKIASDLSDLEKDVAAAKSYLASIQAMAPTVGQPRPITKTRQERIRDAVVIGAQKYTKIPVPALALYAIPKASRDASPEARALSEVQAAATEHVADQFEKGVPSARVIRILGASHVIWESNEAEVVREMNVFMDGLK